MDKPVIRSQTKRAETGHNSLFRGLAQSERVTPTKMEEKRQTLHIYYKVNSERIGGA